MYKVLVIDKIIPLSNIERKALEKVDATIEQVSCKNSKEIIEKAKNADAIMQVNIKLDKEAIEGLNRCKIISHYGVGVDSIDLKAATNKGIIVSNVPEYCQKEVATLALTLLLACERRVLIADQYTKNGKWEQAVGYIMNKQRSVHDKTLGLLGFGSIAREFVKLIKPFKMRLLAYDPYINKEILQEFGLEVFNNYKEMLKQCDYLSIHVPLTDSTQGMIGKEELKLMKRDSIIINTGRGAVIKQKELYEALKNGEIAYAGLDVLEKEPPDKNDPLFKLENVITSGHIAGGTIESMERLRVKAVNAVVSVLSGEMPEVVVNKEVIENFKKKWGWK